jgi:hypothetical protein
MKSLTFVAQASVVALLLNGSAIGSTVAQEPDTTMTGDSVYSRMVTTARAQKEPDSIACEINTRSTWMSFLFTQRDGRLTFGAGIPGDTSERTFAVNIAPIKIPGGRSGWRRTARHYRASWGNAARVTRLDYPTCFISFGRMAEKRAQRHRLPRVPRILRRRRP